MSRGGARLGAGRKPINRANKRKSISISVAPITSERIAQLKVVGYRIGKIVDDTIEEIYNSFYNL